MEDLFDDEKGTSPEPLRGLKLPKDCTGTGKVEPEVGNRCYYQLFLKETISLPNKMSLITVYQLSAHLHSYRSKSTFFMNWNINVLCLHNISLCLWWDRPGELGQIHSPWASSAPVNAPAGPCGCPRWKGRESERVVTISKNFLRFRGWILYPVRVQEACVPGLRDTYPLGL